MQKYLSHKGGAAEKVFGPWAIHILDEILSLVPQHFSIWIFGELPFIA